MSSREGSMRCRHATDFYSPASTCVFGARACNHVILRYAVGLQVRAAPSCTGVGSSEVTP